MQMLRQTPVSTPKPNMRPKPRPSNQAKNKTRINNYNNIKTIRPIGRSGGKANVEENLKNVLFQDLM